MTLLVARRSSYQSSASRMPVSARQCMPPVGDKLPAYSASLFVVSKSWGWASCPRWLCFLSCIHRHPKMHCDTEKELCAVSSTHANPQRCIITTPESFAPRAGLITVGLTSLTFRAAASNMLRGKVGIEASAGCRGRGYPFPRIMIVLSRVICVTTRKTHHCVLCGSGPNDINRSIKTKLQYREKSQRRESLGWGCQWGYTQKLCSPSAFCAKDHVFFSNRVPPLQCPNLRSSTFLTRGKAHYATRRKERNGPP
jgi:hypothetical protein